MSSLKSVEKRVFEDIFEMDSGYVMDFTNATFAEFFRDVANIDIYSSKYSLNGTSKAKLLRAFWTLENDDLVGLINNELLDVWEYTHNANGESKARYEKCREIAAKLRGGVTPKTNTKEDFLKKEINLPNLDKLNVEPAMLSVLSSRLDEIQKGLEASAPLSVIFMCGSVLEGVLLNTAALNPKLFNQSKCSPKDSEGKIKQLNDWKLAELIEVACDTKFIKLDVKKFSHVLRDFRNYIHPHQQMIEGFSPDRQTAEICFQVLKAALSDISKER